MHSAARNMVFTGVQECSELQSPLMDKEAKPKGHNAQNDEKEHNQL